MAAHPCAAGFSAFCRDSLILAHRPFTTLQPYAELGPIFLCADHCERYPESQGPPQLYRHRDMLLRGYDADERIVYGSGRLAPERSLEAEARRLFDQFELFFIHARSPTNNCYHFRIEAD